MKLILSRAVHALRYCGLLTPPPVPLRPRSHKTVEKEWHLALLGTGVGLISGFLATGLTMAVTHLSEGDLLRGMWEIAIALLLGSSTLIRLRSHNALTEPVPYDLTFLAFDLLLIGATSVALGLIASPHFPSRAFWIATAFVGLSIFLRRVRLSGNHGYQLPSGQWLLLLGVLAAVTVAIIAPISQRWAWLMVVMAVVGVVIAFLVEIPDKNR